MTKYSTPQSLLEFQHNFGSYLRNQEDGSFEDAPRRAITVYQELIFNNIKGFLDKCFPICQRIIGSEQWLALCLHFFKKSHLHSPYFIEINRDFVDFLYQQDLTKLELPAFLTELAHYEWIELYVDIHTDELSPEQLAHPAGTLLLHPSVQNLHYQWPVHCIDETHLPAQTKDTFLLVFRNKNLQVTFVELGILSYALLEFLAENPCQNPSLLVNKFLSSIQQSDNKELRQATESTLQDFLQQHIIIYR